MLRIGIIGTGAIADAHIRGWRAFPDDARIVAVADVVPGRAAAKAADAGLGDVSIYEDTDAMLREERLDIVSVVTPPSTHAGVTIAALDAGVHVLVEKPMAPSLEQCDAMLAAQRRSGKVLSVVAQNRFRDDTATLKAVLDSGLIGSVSHVRVDSAWWRGVPYYDLAWRGTWEQEGGGCTLNHAIHHVDLLLWLMGRPSEVTAMLTNAQHDNSAVEDLSVAVLRYERALAQLTSSVVHHGEEQTIVVQGADASVSQPWSVHADVTQPNGMPAEGGDPARAARIESFAASRAPLAHTGHDGQIDDVIRAVLDGRPPLIDGEQGRAAVELVTAIYEAGIERAHVRLPLTAEDPYYRSAALIERAPRFRAESALDPSLA